MDLHGKIVTSGATGLGRATALALVCSGVSVAVNHSRSEAEAHETAQTIEAARGGRWRHGLPRPSAVSISW